MRRIFATPEKREAGPALALFVTTWRLMSKLISKYDILQSSKRKKQVIFGSLGSQIVLLILSDSKSRYTLKLAAMSDESNVVKLNRTRGRDVVWLWQTFFSKSGIFSCDVWHILQRLRHSLRFDKWHWLPSDVRPCQISVLPPCLSPYFAVLGHLFGQFLGLGPHHCTAHLIREKDGSPGNWFIRLSQTKIFWLAEISGWI